MTGVNKKTVWDGNGGQVEVDPATAVIVTHLEYMRKDITSIKEGMSGLNSQIDTLGEQMTTVRAETEENTFFRKLVIRGIVAVTVIAGISYLFSVIFSKLGG